MQLSAWIRQPIGVSPVATYRNGGASSQPCSMSHRHAFATATGWKAGKKISSCNLAAAVHVDPPTALLDVPRARDHEGRAIRKEERGRDEDEYS